MRAMSSGWPKCPSGVPATTSFSKSLSINGASARPFCVNDTRRNGVEACLGKNFLRLLQHWSGVVMCSASHDGLSVRG